MDSATTFISRSTRRRDRPRPRHGPPTQGTGSCGHEPLRAAASGRPAVMDGRLGTATRPASDCRAGASVGPSAPPPRPHPLRQRRTGGDGHLGHRRVIAVAVPGAQRAVHARRERGPAVGIAGRGRARAAGARSRRSRARRPDRVRWRRPDRDRRDSLRRPPDGASRTPHDQAASASPGACRGPPGTRRQAVPPGSTGPPAKGHERTRWAVAAPGSARDTPSATPVPGDRTRPAARGAAGLVACGEAGRVSPRAGRAS